MEKLEKIVESKVFQRIILAFIILNSIILGLQTSPEINGVLGEFFIAADRVCLCIFIAEMLMKLAVYKNRYFKDGWNIFDFLIIIISIFSDLPSFSSFRIFRIFRVFRSLKAIRGLKIVSNLKHLQIIILAIGKAIPSISWTSALLLLIYYIFAIMGVSLFGTAFPDWFGTLPKAMYTLFQVMTLESWSMGISRPVMEVYPMAWLYFIPFVLISAFIVMNVVIGIVVNSISEVTSAESFIKSAVQKEVPASDEDILKEIDAVKKHLSRLEEMIENSNHKV